MTTPQEKLKIIINEKISKMKIMKNDAEDIPNDYRKDPSNFAFEITPDDVAIVFQNATGNKISQQHANKILARLDIEEIVQQALLGNDLDEQTQYAYEEILRQCIKKGIIKSGSSVINPAVLKKIR